MSDNIVNYLREVKIRLGLKSDRQLASKIGITGVSMCNIMNGNSAPSEETCIKVARLAGDDPAIIIALARKSKSSDSARPYWDKILKVLATCSIMALLFLSTCPTSARADNHSIKAQDILCKIILKILLACGLYLSGLHLQRSDEKEKHISWRSFCSKFKSSLPNQSQLTVMLKYLMI